MMQVCEYTSGSLCDDTYYTRRAWALLLKFDFYMAERGRGDVLIVFILQSFSFVYLFLVVMLFFLFFLYGLFRSSLPLSNYKITSAVGHLHSQNIAHRDLKPENLLLQDKSEVQCSEIIPHIYIYIIYIYNIYIYYI